MILERYSTCRIKDCIRPVGIYDTLSGAVPGAEVVDSTRSFFHNCPYLVWQPRLLSADILTMNADMLSRYPDERLHFVGAVGLCWAQSGQPRLATRVPKYVLNVQCSSYECDGSVRSMPETGKVIASNSA